MAKKISEDAFMADLKATNTHAGMVMNKPPVGPSKSLDEVLRDQVAIIATVPQVEVGDISKDIPISLIVRSPFQVRHVNDQSIDDLAESIIDTQGLITPIVVRELADGHFELVAGHTRFEACRRLGKTTIPAIIKHLTDSNAAKALAADNLTRKDLSDFEIFKQIAVLELNGFVKTNSEVARLLGRTRQDIIRYKAYSKLPPEVIEILEKDPFLIGANCAKELVDLVDGDLATFVVDGCRRLSKALIKNQSGLIIWIHQQKAVRSVRSEFRVCDSNGKAFGKVSVTSSGIKISGRGFDFDAVEELLRRELPGCKSEVY